MQANTVFVFEPIIAFTVMPSADTEGILTFSTFVLLQAEPSTDCSLSCVLGRIQAVFLHEALGSG